MQHQLTSEQLAFKAEVAAFLSANLPWEIAAKVRRGQAVAKDELTQWTRTLNAQGWAAPGWPKAFGGTGWNLVQRHIFDVACREVHAPALSGFGFNMVGPAIIKFGTARQQADLLPKIRNADLWFCQGYSEPEAGSDLASLRTRADRDGDDYIINGSKIWTSGAELADWIFCLVRTNDQVQQQRGISFLLMDLASPGVTVEPLYAFNGKRLWNQVFFENVRVPVQQRLGEEDQGWTVAKSLLGDERLMVSRVAENKRILSLLKEALALQQAQDIQLPPEAEAEIAALEIRLMALETTSLRILSQADAGAQIGAEPSMLKLKGSELVQDQDELLFRLIDYLALPQDTSRGDHPAVTPPWAEYVASGRYHHRGYTIAGGSSEIQHNIIAKQVLGL
ncbi:MAG TPA: pimeloyl-CoA dehydrogenase large subunit [Gammaproteobacteria bacterium]|nr:MAG: pimeloyl-CoA dehydrogenase large subunit [OM182 bacterium]HAL42758.1 pimeloyl-CoA dehydrogenase large subunit [Gammaproteobacteria bacterium]HBK17517.1 pimeloyl-CoA dehydrogenase large subunit [Gammaproteobacteria bacterium]|tara:strand:+ start:8210 stop:9388 length:1179 start_codon:yes stop_codon:yes gene_type:complete